LLWKDKRGKIVGKKKLVKKGNKHVDQNIIIRIPFPWAFTIMFPLLFEKGHFTGILSKSNTTVEKFYFSWWSFLGVIISEGRECWNVIVFYDRRVCNVEWKYDMKSKKWGWNVVNRHARSQLALGVGMIFWYYSFLQWFWIVHLSGNWLCKPVVLKLFWLAAQKITKIWPRHSTFWNLQSDFFS
jgi:hypothetical protein